MVYYFTSTRDDTPKPYSLYMGKHKEENEDLIKYGRANDVWFHVDNLSSAHVYLRLDDDADDESWENLPEGLLEDCAQLTKANSIDGNKRDNITVIYTPWSNLRKTKGMATGQVGFKKEKLVKKVYVQSRTNAIVNRLSKTKIERFPDLRLQKLEYEMANAQRNKTILNEKYKREYELAQERKQLAFEKDHAYDDMFSEQNIKQASNQNRDENWEDDFM
ncbi:hypothetical protein V1514DRAFT_324219 [Lipomyces japonicus]|uniref:uncharacterized protein n=1 Tax=Lipomyces japonicus TaxID=56871 RepID=UPI0034CE8A31